MKVYEEKDVVNGKLKLKAAEAPPPPAPSTGSSWVDRVYGAEPKRPKLFERADAVNVIDLA